ncbi:hypothetical protein IAQ67_29075 (plasmid) [Paenibacillus peoriae]|uniref:Uncharacterized protein n=1 Tax=Paenibacillus peoriae TaxID=59893 RepID=A0A7H0YH50_9BACL|nr:hypothetical protein [Paenibacillus peoriae]QNR70408.1 hypothetical protein IAQ67_29075 [Paenibacillus peoriae]
MTTDYTAFRKAQGEIESAVRSIAEQYNLSDIEVHNILSPLLSSYYCKVKIEGESKEVDFSNAVFAVDVGYRTQEGELKKDPTSRYEVNPFIEWFHNAMDDPPLYAVKPQDNTFKRNKRRNKRKR